MTAEPIIITADEINCLIYSYFQDAGFNHSAFALRNEGRLQSSPYFSKHIPRGELIELLSKALLYLEVESHWRNDELTTNCKAGFSLLEPHVCSLDPTATKSAQSGTPMELNETSVAPNTGSSSAVSLTTPTPTTMHRNIADSSHSQANFETGSFREALPLHEQVLLKQSQTLMPTVDGLAKRKTSPVPIDGPVEKRARRGSPDMDIDINSDSAQARSPVHEAYDFYQARLVPNKPAILPHTPYDQAHSPGVVLRLSGHRTEVFVCAFNPKMHNLLASGSKDGVVNLWNLPDPPNSFELAEAPGEPIALENVSRAPQGDLTSLDWNSEGTLLALGSYDSVLRVCTNQGSVYFSHPQHQGPIFATRFSKNGAWLLTASLDGTTCLWDVRGKRLHKQYRCHKDCCLDVEWLSEDTFASAGADMRIFLMQVDKDDPIKTLNGHKDEINQIKVNPSGTRLASCSDDGTACIWNVDNIKEAIDVDAVPGLSSSYQALILKGHNHSVSTVGWCVDYPAGTNELLATSSFDGTARLWDSVTGECLHVFRDHRRPLYALTFSPDGRLIATGSGDGWMHIYHTRTHVRIWSWYAGSDKPGVFEIDWQEQDGVNRLALALECREVAVLDMNKLPVFHSPELRNGNDPQLMARIESVNG